MTSPEAWAIHDIPAEARIARQMLYIVLGGKEGVGGADDFKPSQMDTPGAGIKVLGGTVAAVSQYSAAFREMYMGSRQAAENVSIAATGSGSGRTDLVVFRFEDSVLDSGTWSESALGLRVIPNIGQYVGSPASVTKLSQLGLGQTGFAVARVTLPPSTATVTDAMITDLRRIASPQEEPDPVSGQQVQVGSTQNVPTGGTYDQWPVEAQWSVAVPSYPSRATLGVIATGVLEDAVGSGPAVVDVRLMLGSTQVTNVVFYGNDESVQSTFQISRSNWPVPSAMRGTTQIMRLTARRIAGFSTIKVHAGTVLKPTMEFRETT